MYKRRLIIYFLIILLSDSTYSANYPFSVIKEGQNENFLVTITPNEDQYIAVGKPINLTCIVSNNSKHQNQHLFIQFAPENQQHATNKPIDDVINFRGSSKVAETGITKPALRPLEFRAMDPTSMRLDPSVGLTFKNDVISNESVRNGGAERRLTRSKAEAEISDAGLYRCCLRWKDGGGGWNDKCAAQTAISVGNPPSSILRQDLQIFSNNFEDLNVVVCDKNKNIRSYELRYSMGNQPLNRYCNLTDTNNNTCKLCSWKKRSLEDNSLSPLFIPFQIYTVSVSAQNPFGTWNKNHEFEYTIDTKNFSIVIPRPVEKLSVGKISHDSASITYEYPGDLENFLKLNFSITIKEIMHADFTQVINSIDETKHNLSDLIPYTRYKVSVRCTSQLGMYWSPMAEVNFETKSIRPSFSPEYIDGGIFIDQNKYIIFWKPVPQRNFNGPNFRYIIKLIPQSDRSRNVTTPLQDISLNTTFVLVENSSVGRVELAAQNDVGRSEYRSLDLSTYLTEHLDADFWGEADDDLGVLKISWENKVDSDSYTLLYCKFNNFNCKSNVHYIYIPANRSTVTMETMDDVISSTFFMSTNFANKTSTGLRKVCMHRFDGVPQKVDHFIFEETHDTLYLQWENPKCVEGSGRILAYKLQINNHTILIPSTETNYTVFNWTGNCHLFNITLTSISRKKNNIATLIMPPLIDVGIKIYLILQILTIVFVFACVVFVGVVAICKYLKKNRKKKKVPTATLR